MLFAAALAALDQATKAIVAAALPLHARVEVTPWFNLVHVLNPGAAFSFLADASGWQRYFLSAIGLTVSAILLWMLWRGVKNRLEAVAYAGLIGGALGNVIDRLRLGAVVDYARVQSGRHPGRRRRRPFDRRRCVATYTVGCGRLRTDNAAAHRATKVCSSLRQSTAPSQESATGMVRTALLFVVCIAVAACQPQKFNGVDITGSSIGPDFSLADHTGTTRKLADFRGKVVVLFFGFMNCPAGAVCAGL